MKLELENINNLVVDDLDLRNRNWSAIDDALDTKAYKSDTYTKTEVDTSLGLKANKTYVDNQDFALTARLAEIENGRLTLKNEVVNGDFSSPDISHIQSALDLQVVSGMLKASKSNYVYASGGVIIIQNGYNSWVAGDKYYVKGMIKVTGDTAYPIRFGSYDETTDLLLNANDYRDLKSVSGVISPPTKNFAIRHFLEGAEYVEIILDNFVSINLTKTFGAGNEPTKLEMDELMKVIPNGWWDGELTLEQKEVVQWLLKLETEKVNKQQEDWITPTLLNGWTSSTFPVRYFKDTLGFVHICGIATGGTSGVIFNLPLGYRPLISQFGVGMKSALSTSQAPQLFEVRAGSAGGDLRLYAESTTWGTNFAFRISYFVGV